MRVSLFDTDTPLAPLRARIQERVAAVIASGRFILGPEVASFESELADYLGVRHVIGVGNGTDAITIALRALAVAPGHATLEQMKCGGKSNVQREPGQPGPTRQRDSEPHGSLAPLPLSRAEVPVKLTRMIRYY